MSYFLAVEHNHITVKYDGDKVQVLKSIEDYNEFFQGEGEKYGVDTVRMLLSSTITWAEEFTNDSEVLALAELLNS